MFIKLVRRSLNVLLPFLPFAISWLAVHNGSPFLGIVSILAIYLVVALLPYTKRHENIWIFLLSSISNIPINIRLISTLGREFILEGEVVLLHLMRYVLIYVIVFCVEQIVLGFIARLIWRRQKVGS